MNYQKKYIKYKIKYLKLKKLVGGGENENLEFFLDYNNKCNDIIKKYESFDNNVKTNYSYFNMKNINLPTYYISHGANGAINNFNFKNNIDENNFNIIVKTSLDSRADNLFYEYMAGQCVNKFKRFFPNFCYTFKYLYLNDLAGKFIPKLLSKDGLTDITEFEKTIMDLKLDIPLISKENFKLGCSNNHRVSIMLENIPKSFKFSDLLDDSEFKSNLDYNFFCCMFQLYMCLYSLSNVFTHYDLNANNVMYTKLDKPIKITYDIKQYGKIIDIYTKYIPVIIDYARAHVNCPDLSINSADVHPMVCSLRECNNRRHPLCDTQSKGMFFGTELYPDGKYYYNDFKSFHNINPREINQSHDLLHLHTLMRYYFKDSKDTTSSKLALKLKDSYKKVFDYALWTKSDLVTPKYGNIRLRNSYDSNPKKINTTQDVVRWLMDYFKDNFKDYSTEDYYAKMCITTNLSSPFEFSLK
jgi:hypothetical protein